MAAAEAEGNTKTLLSARASLKKKSGFLYLTDEPHRLVWVNEQTGQLSMHFLTTELTNLFANKAGMLPPKLKVVVYGVDYNLVFTDEEPLGTMHRDSFRDQVKALIRGGGGDAGNGQSSSVAGGGDAVDDPGSPDAAPSPASSIDEDGPPPPSPPVTTSALPPVAPVPTGDPVKEAAAMMFRLRKKILLDDPELAALHRAVVIKGKLSENDFWASRQHLVDEAAAMENQRKGKSSRLIDPKPGISTTGDMKMTITPQLAQDIFEEWPVIRRAFAENVPTNMNETQFWKRYFESRLYHNHKASVRSAAAQHIIKEDPIFDKYLEPVDDGEWFDKIATTHPDILLELEPRHARQIQVNRLVDLVATSEDHGQTGNTEDVTMRAGKQKATLPLIRKYNEHSERLLNSALGEMLPVKRVRMISEKTVEDFDEIDIEDLHGDGDQGGITLDMKNRQRYFEGRTTTSESAVNVDFKTALSGMKGQLTGWESSLKTVHQDGKAGSNAVRLMSKNISARTRVKTAKLDVSAEFFAQMKALEAAGNEYLRQFWYLIYPPPEGAPRLPPEERGKKAGAMRDQLVWVQKRAPELVHQAATNRWDSAGVEEAFKPMMGAIDKALGFVAGRK